jgi:hypothetical protein
MQLTEAEASFRALKSELSIRPLFHQKEPRVKAHVLVAFLGYALWVTLKHRLKRRPALVPQASTSGVFNAQPLSPMKVLGFAVQAAERRHRTAHDGWTGDPPPPDHRTDDRTGMPASPTRPQSSRTTEVFFKM